MGAFQQLTLADLILNRDGTLTFRVILSIFGIALRLFFRRIETVNAEVVPTGTGVIFVLNHPNGLIDPALVFVALPRKISFLAKSTLFRMPVISFLLRTVEALPLYRRIDAGEDVSKNEQTFDLSRTLLARGGSIALFPEGISHNSPKLLPLKTGAARIALGAAAAGETAVEVKIVPVGLYYTSKTTFRSEALLHFGKPFTVPRVELEDGQPPKDDVRDLTAKIDEELREVTVNAETEAELHVARIAEQIFASAADENGNLGEKLDFLKKYVDERASSDVELDRRVRQFDLKLRERCLEPEHLSLANLTRRFVVYRALVQTWILILLSPFSLFGTILHAPAYQLGKLVAYLYSRHGADDVASTVKVLAGMVFIPLTWVITAVVLYFLSGWPLALASIPVSAICGYIALYSLEEIAEMRGWTRAIWLFLTRREMFLRLFVERRELQTALREFDA
ncbi:MAG TPA: lysophospholipid acyltransferase family protein [Pyrinomonadaceae bacterium]|nr:lysophospholipid acyltransferase family protein [Pyrinomonadaceae bacterium]